MAGIPTQADAPLAAPQPPLTAVAGSEDARGYTRPAEQPLQALQSPHRPYNAPSEPVTERPEPCRRTPHMRNAPNARLRSAEAPRIRTAQASSESSRSR